MGMVTEQVTGVLRTLTIFDVLDISIVSVMIYQAFAGAGHPSPSAG